MFSTVLDSPVEAAVAGTEIMSLGKLWKGLAALGRTVSLQRGKGNSPVLSNGSTNSSWHSPKAAGMVGQLQWALGVHRALMACTQSDLGR